MRRALLLLPILLLFAANSRAQQSIAERLGYPRDAKLLIVHADDLGMAHSVNVATTKAFETSLVNSGSIMAPCPWLSEIADYARKNPQADLGLHLTLTSEWTSFRWGPVSPRDRVSSLLDKDGYFYLTETEAAAHADPKEVEMILTPDDVYIDRVLDINPSVAPGDWSKFYSDAIKNLEPGVTEIVIHLAYDDAEMRGATFNHPDWGAAWRQRDFEFFTSNSLRKLLQENQVKLITWRELGRLIK